MSRSGKPIFTPAEVFQIRLEWDSQTIDVRAWASVKSCVPETIRKIGRRDTYTTGEYAAELTGHAPPTLPVGGDEPSDADIASSFARLQAAVNTSEVQRVEVERMLDEATSKKEP